MVNAMAVDYVRKQQFANRLLTKYGFTTTLRRTENSGDKFNPTQTTTDYTVTVYDQGNVVVSENRAENVAVRERQFWIGYSKTLVPRKGDVLVVGELEYEVIRVDTVSPGNINIIYNLAVKT